MATPLKYRKPVSIRARNNNVIPTGSVHSGHAWKHEKLTINTVFYKVIGI